MFFEKRSEMICRKCDYFNGAPGVKWGLCERVTCNNTENILKRPTQECSFDDQNEQEETDVDKV